VADTCNFAPAHEPWGCTVHHGVRLTLTETTCNRIAPAPTDTLREAVNKAAHEVAYIATDICNDWMGDPDHGFTLDRLARAVDVYIAAGTDFMTETPVGPIQHANSMCQKDGCTCWCQACERHNWRHAQSTPTDTLREAALPTTNTGKRLLWQIYESPLRLPEDALVYDWASWIVGIEREAALDTAKEADRG
jgi:hypothetical protein